MTRPPVVIVDGGFAGLQATRGLAHVPVRITVLDRQNHHLFQPMLYEVATAVLAPSDIASPIRSILSSQSNVEVLLGEVAAVQPDHRKILVGDGSSIEYDYFAIAARSRDCYFGHDEWEPWSPGRQPPPMGITGDTGGHRTPEGLEVPTA